MGSAEERRSATWVRCLTIAIKIACAILVAASLVYLVVAGMHFAVISGLFSQAEIEGTRTIIGYCLAMFALFLGAAATGVWACEDAEGLSRRMPICAGVALVPPALIAVAVGTSMFGMADSAFSSIGFIKWIDLSCGACAVVFAALAVIAWRLDAKAGAACDDDAACGDDAAGDDDVAGDDGVAGGDDVADDGGAADGDDVVGGGASETDDQSSEEEADRGAEEDGARPAATEYDVREEPDGGDLREGPDGGDLQEEPVDAGARAAGADDAEDEAAAGDGVDEDDGEEPLPTGRHWAGARRVFEDPDDFLFSDASARDWQWEDA